MKIAALLERLARSTREAIDATAMEIGTRLTALEQRFADLPVPKDGTSVTIEEVRPLVEESVGEAVKAIRVPEDGKSVDLADVVAAVQPAISSALEDVGKSARAQVQGAIDALPNLSELISNAVKALPAPKDGVSVTVEQVLPTLQAELREAIAAIPVPADGKSVTVEDVAAAVLPALVERVETMGAKWALDFERRAQETLQRAVERIPVPEKGKDGIDGLGVEDLQLEFDGERTLTVKLVRGDVMKSATLKFPAVIDRSVFRDGAAYERGDAVTFGGSLWIAQKDAPAGKPGLSDDWRLAVKKGRDGKQGDAGRDFRPQGPVKL